MLREDEVTLMRVMRQEIIKDKCNINIRKFPLGITRGI